MRVVVVGDCLFDVTVRPAGPIADGGDTAASIELLPGGSGANVAVRLARRGVRVRLGAPLGDDAAGRLLAERLAADGVELASLPADRTGVVVSLIAADGERTLLSGRVAFPRGLAVRHALRRMVAGAGWAHLSGHALIDATGGDAVAASAGSLPAGVVRSADAGGVTGPAAAAVLCDRLGTAGVSLVLASRAEAGWLLAHAPGGETPLPQLAGDLARRTGSAALVTGGREGSAAALGTLALAMPAYAPDAPMVDATGAGDAYAAAAIAVLAEAGWPPDEARLRRAMAAGSELASRVVRVLGAQAAVAEEGRV
jgi:ribokinase